MLQLQANDASVSANSKPQKTRVKIKKKNQADYEHHRFRQPTGHSSFSDQVADWTNFIAGMVGQQQQPHRHFARDTIIERFNLQHMLLSRLGHHSNVEQDLDHRGYHNDHVPNYTNEREYDRRHYGGRTMTTERSRPPLPRRSYNSSGTSAENPIDLGGDDDIEVLSAMPNTAPTT